MFEAPFFKGLERMHCSSLLLNTKEIVFSEGDTIVSEGAFSNAFYIIVNGSIRVVKMNGDEEVSLTKVADGLIVGEMATYHQDRWKRPLSNSACPQRARSRRSCSLSEVS